MNNISGYCIEKRNIYICIAMHFIVQKIKTSITIAS